MNPYKDYSWVELIKLRDALLIAKEVARDGSREWAIFDEELSFISDEIDRQYKQRGGNGVFNN